ncbi:hypothetical protein J1N35_017605 [Gossypium stocksii]|uniref:RNase H type-1 domain-containing protein n=1 Tax=Gossypium stocksii TaxID=47602 RepID=A0A9D3VPC1_9ROSI|nr:hypothetical protein J1N35_017605 [Gossypium stocksii]
MRSMFWMEAANTFDVCKAELRYIKMALELFLEASKFESHGLLIEPDPSTAVLWFIDASKQPWKFWELFKLIDNLVEKIGGVIFTNIFREANSLANALAKVGLSRHVPSVVS